MKKSRLIIGLALLSLGVTSCKEDYFDAEEYKALVKKAFPVKEIDENHTWATMGTASVKVSVNQPGNETYRVRIYDSNPIDNKSGLTLLGQGTIGNGQSLETAISYPLAMQYAYVALYDSKNFMSVYPTAIQDGKLEANIGGGSASVRARAHRIAAHDFSFIEMPGAEKFVTAIPQGAKNENEYHQTQSGNFFVEQSDNNINVWSGNANIYFAKGTYNITSLGLNNNTSFYLLPGANVTMPGSIKYKDINFYIAAGATLNIDINAVAHFYNKGTIISNSINLYSEVSTQYYTNPNADNGTLINDGTITVNGEYHVDDYSQTVNNYLMQVGTLTIDENAQFLNTNSLSINGELGVKNDNSLFVNKGNALAGSVAVEGSADFYNDSDGTITVGGNTVVNSNQCTWHNDGTYTTENYTYQAGSMDVINNCRLIVNELFYLGLGDTSSNCFQLNGGGSVVTKDFQFSGPGYLVMGGGSLFKVTGTAHMGITKDNYGIYGPADGDYAVFQAREIVRADNVDPNQGFVANYFGHLFVATDSHFNFGYSDKSLEQQAAGEVGAQPYYRLDAESGAKMVTYNGANVVFPDNGCGAAYSGEPEDGEAESTPEELRFCFEDNFPEPGDYDFNDAVFSVSPIIDGNNVTLKIKLEATGARKTLAAALRIKGLSRNEVDVTGITREGSFDEGLPLNMESFIPGNEGVMDDDAVTDGSFVIKVAGNIHWALRQEKDPTGDIKNWFYNTVRKNEGNYPYYENGVEPREVTYHITTNHPESALKFVHDNIDLFIIESYNGAFWEVHTTPFKYDQVLKAHYMEGKYDSYKYEDIFNYPWAISVPGSFKYPMEWQYIGAMEGTFIDGAFREEGHSFGEWAKDHNQATDWYNYPDEELIYK